MNFATLIAVLALAVILFLAVRYIYREKKKERPASAVRTQVLVRSIKRE